jgi:hypothetical protein
LGINTNIGVLQLEGNVIKEGGIETLTSAS